MYEILFYFLNELAEPLIGISCRSKDVTGNESIDIDSDNFLSRTIFSNETEIVANYLLGM